MSLAALCVVTAHVIFVGTLHEVDEGAAAHMFQLFVVGQAPIIAFFAFKWLKLAEKRSLLVLATQILLAAVACVPVWYFDL